MLRRTSVMGSVKFKKIKVVSGIELYWRKLILNKIGKVSNPVLFRFMMATHCKQWGTLLSSKDAEISFILEENERARRNNKKSKKKKYEEK